jgi:hypothetical protein
VGDWEENVAMSTRTFCNEWFRILHFQFQRNSLLDEQIRRDEMGETRNIGALVNARRILVENLQGGIYLKFSGQYRRMISGLFSVTGCYTFRNKTSRSIKGL